MCRSRSGPTNCCAASKVTAPRRASRNGSGRDDAGDPPCPAVDWEGALARLAGDRELLVELVGVFLEECPKLRRSIAQAIDQQDAAGLKLAAHTLKGAVGNFVAKPAFEAALRLETLAKDGNLTGIRAAQAELERELDLVLPVLVAYGR